MKTFLHSDTSDAIIKVWKGFGNLYKIVNNWAPDEDPSIFFHPSQGMGTRLITPYIHIMVTHIPKCLELYKSVKIFIGQGVERNNDMARSVILKTSKLPKH